MRVFLVRFIIAGEEMMIHMMAFVDLLKQASAQVSYDQTPVHTQDDLLTNLPLSYDTESKRRLHVLKNTSNDSGNSRSQLMTQ